MSPATSNRELSTESVTLQTPLGSDAFSLQGFSYREELGRPFEMVLELESSTLDIDFTKLLGQSVTVTVTLPDGSKRPFNGLVSRFQRIGTVAAASRYRLTAVPWLLLLDKTSNSQIFQSMTSREILSQVFNDAGFSDFSLNGINYVRTWDYCVQYRETLFGFASRLMEKEGMYYFFEHASGSHTLALCDSFSNHSSFPGYSTIPYAASGTASLVAEEIYQWNLDQSVQPGSYAVKDFNFTNPSSPLLSTETVPQQYANGSLEMFDYPGGFQVQSDGDNYATIRIDETNCQQTQYHGKAYCWGLSAGYSFTLSGFPVRAENQTYLTTRMRLEMKLADATPGSRSDASDRYAYDCEFSAIPLTTQYRSTSSTKKPLIHGVQTAVVVGPSGQSPTTPYTDEYGRVKVQFHWDRVGQNNENSSCWLRVSQISAGNQWGSLFTPRIGNEVVVAFEEGDPDRPMIVGCVYNASQMPPLSLPDNATHSIIQDDGGNYISLDPTSGAQLVTIYSPQDDTILKIGNAS